MSSPLKEGDYVNQKGTNNPTGIIEHVWRGDTGIFARVRWGTADNQTFKDDFPLDELIEVQDRIWSSDAVLKRQAAEKGGRVVEENSQ